jgi:RNA polymerase sigma factor (TIGR02999 family)
MSAITDSPGDVTALLLRWRGGDAEALDALLPQVQRELHDMARRCMAGERVGHTLQPTALVNEAYVRLVDVRRVNWQNRAHFLAMAARVMRRVLVDAARSRRAHKRGGEAVRVTFDEALPTKTDDQPELIALDDALQSLARIDARKSHVIELRFFAGLSVEETATVLGVSADTVLRDWRLAKAWLTREMNGHRDG